MTSIPRARILGVALAIVVGLALLAPIHAKYIANFDSGADFVIYRTASCGAPITSLLGSDPTLDDVSRFSTVQPGPGYFGGSTSAVELVNARASCRGAAGTRVSSGLALLLVALLAMWLTARRSARAAPVQLPQA